MTLYHATTPKKMDRYRATGCILPPVRGWSFASSAWAWAQRVQRPIVLRIEVGTAYPLPDHRPRGHAWWTPEMVRSWEATIQEVGV